MSNLLNNDIKLDTLGLGTILKFNREEKGYTIKDVSSKTFINEKYLIWLEEEKEIKLPAIIITGFIKHYAKFLELEHNYLIDLYKKKFNIDENNSKMNYYSNNESDNNKMNLDDIFEENKKNVNDNDIIEVPSINNISGINIKGEMEIENNKKIEADNIIEEANLKANSIIEEANLRANSIIEKSEISNIKKETYESTLELLNTLINNISSTLTEIKNGREYLANERKNLI